MTASRGGEYSSPIATGDVMEWSGYDSCWCAADRRALERIADRPSVFACPACGHRTDTPGEGVLGDAFDLLHRQWGMRGDTHLWWAVRDLVATTPTPPTRDEVRAAFVEAIRQAADIDIDHEEGPYVRREHLDHGGMSGGMVHVGWWRNKGLPLLVDRAVTRRPASGATEKGAGTSHTLLSRVVLTVMMLILVAVPVAMVGGGAFLLYQAAWGTRVEVTVLSCDVSGGVFGGAATYRSDCVAEWVIDGRTVVGDFVGGEPDAGTTLTATVRGDTAYHRSIVLPIVLLVLGLPFVVLIGHSLASRRRRH